MGERLAVDGERRRAITRCLAGEDPPSVAASLGRSRRWVYEGLARHGTEDPAWAQDESRRPHTRPLALPARVEEAGQLVRLELDNEGLLGAAQNIRGQLEDLPVQPLPFLRTINCIPVRHGLTHRRTGRSVPTGKVCPTLPAETVNAVHQLDYLGPCSLRGPVRFWRLNTVDLRIARCATEPVRSRAGQATVDARWATGCRRGLPRAVQAANAWAGAGRPGHPRARGPRIRLCLAQGIEPWFLPPGDLWRNGVGEQFNDHYRAKLLARVEGTDFAALGPASGAFEQRHHSRWRSTKLGGLTPLAAPRRGRAALRFPRRGRAPWGPLRQPEAGRYHLVRFIRSDRRLDVLGERFRLPPEAEYAYVVATGDVARQRLRVTLGDDLMEEIPYRLQGSRARRRGLGGVGTLDHRPNSSARCSGTTSCYRCSGTCHLPCASTPRPLHRKEDFTRIRGRRTADRCPTSPFGNSQSPEGGAGGTMLSGAAPPARWGFFPPCSWSRGTRPSFPSPLAAPRRPHGLGPRSGGPSRVHRGGPARHRGPTARCAAGAHAGRGGRASESGAARVAGAG